MVCRNHGPPSMARTPYIIYYINVPAIVMGDARYVNVPKARPYDLC